MSKVDYNKKPNLWDCDSSKYSRDFNPSYFNTINKSHFKNDPKKGKKIQFLDLKYKSNNLFGTINSTLNFKKPERVVPSMVYNHKF